MEIENNPVAQTESTEKKYLELNEDINKILLSAGNWSKFLAILGFVFMGLMVFAGFMMSIVLSFLPMIDDNPFPFPPFLFGIIYFVVAAVYFLPLLYLFRFSSHINKAINSGNQDLLTSAFKNLKAHYRFIGIFMIVSFCLYIVAIIVMVIVGLFAGFSAGFSNLNA